MAVVAGPAGLPAGSVLPFWGKPVLVPTTLTGEWDAAVLRQMKYMVGGTCVCGPAGMLVDASPLVDGVLCDVGPAVSCMLVGSYGLAVGAFVGGVPQTRPLAMNCVLRCAPHGAASDPALRSLASWLEEHQHIQETARCLHPNAPLVYVQTVAAVAPGERLACLFNGPDHLRRPTDYNPVCVWEEDAVAQAVHTRLMDAVPSHHGFMGLLRAALDDPRNALMAKDVAAFLQGTTPALRQTAGYPDALAAYLGLVADMLAARHCVLPPLPLCAARVVTPGAGSNVATLAALSPPLTVTVAGECFGLAPGSAVGPTAPGPRASESKRAKRGRKDKRAVAPGTDLPPSPLLFDYAPTSPLWDDNSAAGAAARLQREIDQLSMDALLSPQFMFTPAP